MAMRAMNELIRPMIVFIALASGAKMMAGMGIGMDEIPNEPLGSWQQKFGLNDTEIPGVLKLSPEGSAGGETLGPEIQRCVSGMAPLVGS